MIRTAPEQAHSANPEVAQQTWPVRCRYCNKFATYTEQYRNGSSWDYYGICEECRSPDRDKPPLPKNTRVPKVDRNSWGFFLRRMAGL